MLEGIRRFFVRRKLLKFLENCNFELAQDMLRKQWAGSVIPKNLAVCLREFDARPCPETALALILFDGRFLASFELAQKGSTLEWVFMESKKNQG